MSNPEAFRPGQPRGYNDLESDVVHYGDLLKEYLDEYLTDPSGLIESRPFLEADKLERNVDIALNIFFPDENEDVEVRRIVREAVLFSIILSSQLSEDGTWGISYDHFSYLETDEEIAEYCRTATEQYLGPRPTIEKLLDNYVPHVCPDMRYMSRAELVVAFNLLNVEMFRLKAFAQREAGYFSKELAEWDGTLPEV